MVTAARIMLTTQVPKDKYVVNYYYALLHEL